MEYYGKTLTEAAHKATCRNRNKTQVSSPNFRRKQAIHVVAKPLYNWGKWVPIFSQIGGDENRPTVKEVTFDLAAPLESVFEVEIKGGDQLVNALGPGSALVTITGNVATTLFIRCRSYSVLLSVRVNVF